MLTPVSDQLCGQSVSLFVIIFSVVRVVMMKTMKQAYVEMESIQASSAILRRFRPNQAFIRNKMVIFEFSCKEMTQKIEYSNMVCQVLHSLLCSGNALKWHSAVEVELENRQIMGQWTSQHMEMSSYRY